MKKCLASLFALTLLLPGFAQNASPLRQPSIGISFFLNDFETARRIRSNSLSEVLREDSVAKFNEMSSGISVSYATGLRSNVDFIATLAGSFVEYPFSNRTVSGENILLEADASALFKLFSERYIVTPYVSVGAGASKYKGYFAAFVPIGAGLKFNLFNEAAIQISSQYRIPVTTTTASYHFMNSISIFGVIGRKKEPETLPAL